MKKIKIREKKEETKNISKLMNMQIFFLFFKPTANLAIYGLDKL